MFGKGGKKGKKEDGNADFDTIDDQAKQSSSKQEEKQGKATRAEIYFASRLKAMDEKAKQGLAAGANTYLASSSTGEDDAYFAKIGHDIKSSLKEAEEQEKAARENLASSSTGDDNTDFGATDKAKQSSSKQEEKQGMASSSKAIDDQAKQSSSKQEEKQGMVAKIAKLLPGSSKASAPDNEVLTEVMLEMPDYLPLIRLMPPINVAPCPPFVSYKADRTQTKHVMTPELQKTFNDFYRAGEVHRTMRLDINNWIKPGYKLIDICERIEETSRHLVGAKALESGLATPVGLAVNNRVTYYTPNIGDETIYRKTDLLKIDFAVHYNGHIVDRAYMISDDHKYRNLIKLTEDALKAGYAVSGIDAYFSEVGDAIKEVLNSHDITVGDNNYRIKMLENLSGKFIRTYLPRAIPKSVRNEKTKRHDFRMEENEVYAIEVFASTGSGKTFTDTDDCTYYSCHFQKDDVKKFLKDDRSKKLYTTIRENYNTMMFCPRWLHRRGEKNYNTSLDEFKRQKIVTLYKPVYEAEDSYVAHLKHTVLMHPSGKQLVSDDY